MNPILNQESEKPSSETKEKSGVMVVEKKPLPKSKRPSMYSVRLLNDDYTPMEFVTHVLETIFNKTHEQATELMLNIHNDGMAIAGIFTYEVAETKIAQVTEQSRSHEYPLQCTMEEEPLGDESS